MVLPSRLASIIVLALTAFSISGAPARVRAVRPGIDEGPAAWLSQRAVRLSTTEPTPIDTDLRPLLDLIGDARIVALADVTHGTHELFSIKQRLIPLLAGAGYRTFAIEAPYAEIARIDDYVRTGIGDPSDLLRSDDYWFWDTEELLSLIRWARNENASGASPQIRFVGIDCTHPVTAAELLVSRLEPLAPALAAEVSASCDCLRTTSLASTECGDAITAVRSRLVAAGLTDDDSLHAARVIEQGREALMTRHENRDAAMAENLLWLADRHDRIVVWGHNEHFGRTPITVRPGQPVVSTGTLLSQRFGPAYFVLGSIVGGGSFNVVEWLATSGMIRELSFTPPSSDDYASLLGAASMATMIVPLRGVLPSWLASPHRIRVAASVAPSAENATYDVIEDLDTKFDALLYIERSTPTQLRRWPIVR